MKWLKVSLVSWMRHKSTPSTTQHFFRLSLQYSGDNEYSCEKRGCVKVKCLGHEHNTVTPARPRISTNRSGDQSANHYNSTSPCPFLFQLKKNRGRMGNRNSHLAALKSFFSFLLLPQCLVTIFSFNKKQTLWVEWVKFFRLFYGMVRTNKCTCWGVLRRRASQRVH